MKRWTVALALAAAMATGAQGNVTITTDTARELILWDSWGPGHATNVAFAPNGKLVAVATTAGVRLYETAAFGEGGDLMEGGAFQAYGVSFSPDSTILAASSTGYNLRAFDTATGEMIEEAYPNDLADSLGGVVVDPTGSTVAVLGGPTLNVYEAEGEQRRFAAVGHESRITQAAYSPDGTKIATSSWDGTARVWDVGDGGHLLTVQGDMGGVMSVSFSPDGARILTASDDGTARVWDAATGEQLGTPWTHDGGGEMVATYSPDGETFAVGDHHGEIHIVNAESGEVLALLGTQAGNVRSLAYSPDGAYLAAASHDEVVLWDVLAQTAVGSTAFEPSLNALAVTSDGARVSTGGAGGVVYTFDAANGAITNEWTAGGPVAALEYAPWTDTLYVGADSSTIYAVDVPSGASVASFDGTGAVVDLTVHPDMPMLNAAMADGALRWWGTDPSEEYGTAYAHEEAALTATAFSPDGVWMASADAGGSIFLWSVASGDFETTVDGAGAQVNDLAFSADSTMLAAAMENGRVAVWGDDPTAPRLTLSDINGAADGVAFSPDGTLLAVAGRDATVRLYDVATGENLTTQYDHNAPVWDIAFSPDGTRVYSAGANGLVLVWGVP